MCHVLLDVIKAVVQRGGEVSNQLPQSLHFRLGHEKDSGSERPLSKTSTSQNVIRAKSVKSYKQQR